MTCDFWGKNAEKKCNGESKSDKLVASLFGLRSGVTPQRAKGLVGDRAFDRSMAAFGCHRAGLKPRSMTKVKARQKQSQSKVNGKGQR